MADAGFSGFDLRLNNSEYELQPGQALSTALTINPSSFVLGDRTCLDVLGRGGFKPKSEESISSNLNPMNLNPTDAATGIWPLHLSPPPTEPLQCIR